MTPALATARLILRPLDLADAATAQRLFPHWEIVRFLASPAVPWPYPPDGAHVFYRDVALPAMARGEAWHWSLRLKEAPERMIGALGLQDRPDNNRGFWIGQAWQGRGLMTEACEAAAAFWFEELGRPLLREPRAAANRASRRIAEKTGMRLVRTEMQDFVCGRLPAELWELRQADWRDRALGSP